MTDENRDDAGRGMLVDEDVSEEMVAAIREKRRTDWLPE